jgi:transposase
MVEENQDVVYRCAAGVDISKSDAKICVRRLPEGARRAVMDTKRFESTVSQVRAAAAWLVEQGVERVVMESTSAYWVTWWDGFRDAGLDTVLSNALMVKQMKGRKTDMADAAWLAKLAALDMAPASFVPPRDIRDLRLVTRVRAKHVRRRTSAVASLEKLLEDTGSKLSVASSKLLTVTGRDILEAICAGVTDPRQLAGLSQLHKVTGESLVDALESRVRPVHRQLIRSHLDLIDALDTQIAALDTQIAQLAEPWAHHVDLLCTIPGVDHVLARSVIAEIGTDMTVFPTSARLAAWAGVAPGVSQSAGRSRPARTRPGDKHLKVLLSQAAQSAARTKDTFIHARFLKVRARRGPAKAYTALAHSLLTSIWAMLSHDEPYRDLGTDYYTRTATTATRARLQANAEATLTRLGVAYTLTNNA